MNKTCWNFIFSACSAEQLMVLNPVVSVEESNRTGFQEASIVVVPRRLSAIFPSKSIVVNATDSDVVIVLNFDLNGIIISEVSLSAADAAISAKRERDLNRFSQMIPLKRS